MSAEPSTTLAATVADESDEIKAEATGSVTPAPATTTTVKEDDERKPSASAEAEAKPDPNALPEDACVTLYLQNLNEKVRIPGTLPPSPFRIFRRLSDDLWAMANLGSDEANVIKLV